MLSGILLVERLYGPASSTSLTGECGHSLLDLRDFFVFLRVEPDFRYNDEQVSRSSSDSSGGELLVARFSFEPVERSVLYVSASTGSVGPSRCSLCAVAYLLVEYSEIVSRFKPYCSQSRCSF